MRRQSLEGTGGEAAQSYAQIFTLTNGTGIPGLSPLGIPGIPYITLDGHWVKEIAVNGAGHYVKMIHNGIEYSMMQGYAEGFELMSKSEYNLDLAKIADVWMHGSVIRSWLLELASGVLAQDPQLEKLKGYVQDSGEGRWTLLDALEKDVPVSTLTAALFTRFRSRQEESFAEKLLAGLRNAFGGHGVKR